MQEVENIDVQSQIEECIMLSLRTREGINLTGFQRRFGFDLMQKKAEVINDLISQNLVEKSDNNLFCTDKGFKLLNRVILALI